ncbi:MAG: hypothetical protein KDE45_03995, partial [Caldilineaceae bacterium]|nr:hypothetical protein [Caldilineaceae bacterium]
MNTHPACDLSIVIVSWNVWPLLEQCLRSIERATLPGDGNVRRFEIGDWRLGDWGVRLAPRPPQLADDGGGDFVGGCVAAQIRRART